MKLSDLSAEQWYARLNSRRRRQRRHAVSWWRYMDNKQPLVFVARILMEQGDRFPPLMINWSDLVIQSVDDRLYHEAFLLAGQDQPIDELTALWRANDLQVHASEAHTASMVSGQSFVMVGPGDADQPLITVEYEDEVAVELDPRSRQPIAGLKVWLEDGTIGRDTLGTLLLPGGRVVEFVNGKKEGEQQLGDWARVLADDPTLPSVPIVPMLTTPRRGCGRSDLVSLKPLVDGANQFATNLMAAGEHHAVGRKWALNVSEKDFVDDKGEQIPLWKVAMGTTWAIPPAQSTTRGETLPEPKVGQFAASDLRNFHESIKMIATLAGSLYGLPPGYMGYTSDNPPSAESILYSLERLVLRSEKRQMWYGVGTWNRAARIAWAILGRDPTELVGLESKWRNAATPTIASRADAAVKLVQAGIIDDEQAWVDIGYSEETKRALRSRRGATGGFATAVVNGLRNLDVGGAGVAPGVNGAPAGIGA